MDCFSKLTLPICDNSASGYLDIGAMRIQWGNSQLVSGTVTVTFPAAFKDAAYSFNTSIYDVETGFIVCMNNKTRSTSAVVVEGRYANASSATNWSTSGNKFSWIAIGLKP